MKLTWTPHALTCISREGISIPIVIKIDIDPRRARVRIVEKFLCCVAGFQSRRNPGRGEINIPQAWIIPNNVI